jgi:hypothetical protein
MAMLSTYSRVLTIATRVIGEYGDFRRSNIADCLTAHATRSIHTSSIS